VFTSPLHRNGSYSIVACVFVAAGMCLPSSCLAIDVCSGSVIPAFRRHVTVCFIFHSIHIFATSLTLRHVRFSRCSLWRLLFPGIWRHAELFSPKYGGTTLLRTIYQITRRHIPEDCNHWPDAHVILQSTPNMSPKPSSTTLNIHHTEEDPNWNLHEVFASCS
jgi:hypothetical protein